MTLFQLFVVFPNAIKNASVFKISKPTRGTAYIIFKAKNVWRWRVEFLINDQSYNVTCEILVPTFSQFIIRKLAKKVSIYKA